MDIRRKLIERIKIEKEQIEIENNSPDRYTELGNVRVMERIKEHKIRQKAFSDLLSDIPVIQYDPVDGVSDEETMSKLSSVALEGDIYLSNYGLWKFVDNKWDPIWKRENGTITYENEHGG